MPSPTQSDLAPILIPIVEVRVQLGHECVAEAGMARGKRAASGRENKATS